MVKHEDEDGTNILIRIISARSANKREWKEYRALNS